MAEILVMKEIDDGGGDDVADDREDDGDGKVAGNFGLDFLMNWKSIVVMMKTVFVPLNYDISIKIADNR